MSYVTLKVKTALRLGFKEVQENRPADIPEAELGYAAIAQALGMAQGSYRGEQTATRGELAAMLCRLLER